MPGILVQDLRQEQPASAITPDRFAPWSGGHPILSWWICGRIEAGESGKGGRSQGAEGVP